MYRMGLGFARPGSTSSFRRCRGNRFGSRIAQAQQHVLGAASVGAFEFVQSLRPRYQAKISFALGAIQAIQERSQINKLGACVHEIKIEELLAVHIVCRSNYNSLVLGHKREREASSKLQHPTSRQAPISKLQIGARV